MKINNILEIVLVVMLCVSMVACNKVENTYDNDGVVNHISEIPGGEQEEHSVDWDAMGGSEDPFDEVYTVAVSGFLIIDGTFTKASTYYDEENQAKFYNALNTYDADTMGIPLMVYLIREMGITKTEYIDYLDAIDAEYSDSMLDILFSDKDDLINETFHSPLTMFHNGEIYTVYELAEMNELSKNGVTTSISQFPAEKIATLYNNIQEFCEYSNISLPTEVVDVCNVMSSVSSNASVD